MYFSFLAITSAALLAQCILFELVFSQIGKPGSLATSGGTLLSVANSRLVIVIAEQMA